jgi:REase_DpnII-MboI
MNSSEELLLGDAKLALLRELKILVRRGDLDEAFAAWLLSEQDIGLQLYEPALTAAARAGAQRTHRDVAILGFAAVAGVLKSTQQEALRKGLLWLSGREPLIDGGPQDFCTDAIALLGIALGAKCSSADTTKNAIADWMGKFINQSYLNRLDDWQKCLLATAQRAVDAVPVLPIPDVSSIADVRVALRAKGVLSTDAELDNQEQMETLLLMKREAGKSIDPIRAALRISAFDSIQRTAPVLNFSRPTIEDICKTLNRIPAALRRWTWEERGRTRGAQARKWYIENEYHVQSLLYFLLAPVFPDLRDEEYTQAVGQMHPRVDLVIPSLRLIIEVKFMRSSDNSQSMIEQIAADASLYLVEGSKYSNIVAFIWDDSRRSEQHDILKSGLRQIKGIFDAIVVSRPGSMTETRQAIEGGD